VLIIALHTPAAKGSGPQVPANILPTPKSVQATGARLLLHDGKRALAEIRIAKGDVKAVIVAKEINDRIVELGGEALPVVPAGGPGAQTATRNQIRLATLQEMDAGQLPDRVRRAGNKIAARGEQAYTIQFTSEKERTRCAFLVGSGAQGLLHAGSTFRLLIGKEGATIYALEVQITDWPDFKNRGLPVWPLPSSFEAFKKYVDWAFRYKFNRIYTTIAGKGGANGFDLPTPEERVYLRKINAYAKERCILINFALNWAVGTLPPEGGVDHLETVLFDGNYYSWSDDRLLQKRARDIAQFASETGAGSLLFHCIDSYEEAWDQRGAKDRTRYGNNRAAADANVINRFTAQIRRVNPGIELQFVAYPYHANFELAGNEQYKTWMRSLSALIPDDVHLVVAELDRDQADSWIANTRQPLVHWVNGLAFQWGRYFSTLPAFTRSAFYEGRESDVIVHMEPIGPFNGEVMQLVASEYEWNVAAPGSAFLREDSGGKTSLTGAGLHVKSEMVGDQSLDVWGWYRGTAEPKSAAGDLLLKACRLAFGPAAAPFMAEFFANNPVGWRAPTLFAATLRDIGAGKELAACQDQLAKTEQALLAVKRALHALPEGSAHRERIRGFAANTYRQYLVISGLTASYLAEQWSRQGGALEADREIKDARGRMVGIRREMEHDGYWSDECRQWYSEGERRLLLVETGRGAAPGPNLIKNPGFEARSASRFPGKPSQSLDSWSAVGTLQLTRDSHSGKQAGRLKLKPTEASVYLEQQVSVPAGCQGYLEFWLKKDGEFRVIPILQYRDAAHNKKVEVAAVDDFPYTAPVGEYRRYYGKLRLPRQARQVVFKVFADWQGFIPDGEKHLNLDDVMLCCAPE